MPTIADLLGIVDRFKRNPWESAQDYARGVARSIPEAGASIIDALPRRPGMGSTTDWLNQRLLGTPLEAKGTNTEGAGGLLGFPGAGTALKGGATALGKLGGLLGAGVMTYHGTPHKFDKFDLSKIGTGEGSQVFGHGLYFAENPAVAETYANMLQPSYLSRNARHLALTAMDEAKARGASDIEAEARKILHERYTSTNPNLRQTLADAMNNFSELVKRSEGKVLKQDLPDEVLPNMLKYDKPIKDQPKALAAIRATLPSDMHKSFDYNVAAGITGDNAMQNWIWGAKTPAERAKKLAEAGIPGLSYLDAGSRGSGMGTLNHVVWDQALLDLMRPQRVE